MTTVPYQSHPSTHAEHYRTVVPAEPELWTIWKHQIQFAEFNVIKMPQDARILHVDEQDSNTALGFIWEMHPTRNNNNLEERHFEIVGTGSLFEETNTRFIGTYQVKSFVWHVFELVK